MHFDLPEITLFLLMLLLFCFVPIHSQGRKINKQANKNFPSIHSHLRPDNELQDKYACVSVFYKAL